MLKSRCQGGTVPNAPPPVPTPMVASCHAVIFLVGSGRTGQLDRSSCENSYIPRKLSAVDLSHNDTMDSVVEDEE